VRDRVVEVDHVAEVADHSETRDNVHAQAVLTVHGRLLWIDLVRPPVELNGDSWRDTSSDASWEGSHLRSFQWEFLVSY
jgi:hypothetical protein